VAGFAQVALGVEEDIEKYYGPLRPAGAVKSGMKPVFKG
jgi:hypothetical protein